MGAVTADHLRESKILVTGAAGFIGYHVCRKLLERGDSVVGVDALTDYYDVSLKQARLSLLTPHECFKFERVDICDDESLERVFAENDIGGVVNLAAEVGVRHSVEMPGKFTKTNVGGFLNVLECCRTAQVKHLVFASSSSVYGGNTKMPFSVQDTVDHPISIYAASKKANELMAHSYAHLFGLSTTGLRFFTVYGPWGRPDMAPYKFTRLIMEGRPIPVYNHGHLSRDFTFVDDVAEGVVRVLDNPAAPDPEWSSDHPNPASSSAPYRVYNIGNDRPVGLMRFIEAIEKATGKTAEKEFLPMQPGDVVATHADVAPLRAATGFSPDTLLEHGIRKFVEWYVDYHQ